MDQAIWLFDATPAVRAFLGPADNALGIPLDEQTRAGLVDADVLLMPLGSAAHSRTQSTPFMLPALVRFSAARATQRLMLTAGAAIS